MNLDQLATDSHTAKDDPFEQNILEILNSNLQLMQPQRQGLSEEDEIDMFELRFITKTIQNLQQKLLINSFDNLLQFLTTKLTIVKIINNGPKKQSDAEFKVEILAPGIFIYVSRALHQIDLQSIFHRVKHNFITTNDPDEISEIAFDSEKWQKCIYEKIPLMKE